MAKPVCFSCKKPIGVPEFLSGLCGYSPDTAHFTARCPQCSEHLEFQCNASSLTFGCTYWAGSMHFEGMIPTAIRGLKTFTPPDPPAIHYDGVTYPVKPD